MNFPRNPQHEKAVNINDVQRDMAFAVVQSGSVVLRGVFSGGTEYNGDEWSFIPAVTEHGEETAIDPYSHGIVCRRNGEWQQDTYVLPQDAQL